MIESVDGATDMGVGVDGAGVRQGDEPVMYLQRPSSAASQDVAHVLARTFRERFTRDPVTTTTVQHLNTSRYGTDDEYHQRYVDALLEVKAERDQRMAEAAMLERHIMQAQARAVSADERAANRSNDVGDMPVQAHFRSCIDSDLLRRHNLIVPEDFTRVQSPVVRPPSKPNVPHHAQQFKRSARPTKSPRNAPSLRNGPEGGGGSEWGEGDVFSEGIEYGGLNSEKDEEEEREEGRKQKQYQVVDSGRSVLASVLWKKQVDGYEKDELKANLNSLQNRVNYLKNARHLSVESSARAKTSLLHNTLLAESSLCLKEAPVILLAIPAALTFTDYTVGQVYELTVELKNMTSVLRPVRAIPPKTQFFSVGLGQFPGDKGLIAAGLSCYYTVRFSPDSLADYNDILTIQSQSQSDVIIPLQARRPPPIITLPHELSIGECLVGGIKICRFTACNQGGDGKFCLIDASASPNSYHKSSWTSTELNDKGVLIGSFEVFPAMFELKRGESMDIKVVFTPSSLNEYTEKLVMICDNCHTVELTLSGIGVKAQVSLAYVEGGFSEHTVDELADITATHLIRFPEINPFSYIQRAISIRNHVAVEISYHWMLVKAHVRPSDLVNSDPVGCLTTLSDDQISSRTSCHAPAVRVQDFSSPFSIDPPSGTLAASETTLFTLTFAPPTVGAYHNALHLVLTAFTSVDNSSDSSPLPSHTDLVVVDDNECVDKTMMKKRVTVKSINSAAPLMKKGELEIVKTTEIELELLAQSVPYKVHLLPPILDIPGDIPIYTNNRKQIQILNASLSSVTFRWQDLINDSVIIHVEPNNGEIPCEASVTCEVMISASVSGEISTTLLCHISHIDEPIPLPVAACVKGPEVVVDQSDINFGLVAVGTRATASLTLRNVCHAAAEWTISLVKPPRRSPRPLTNHLDFDDINTTDLQPTNVTHDPDILCKDDEVDADELEFSPSCGTLNPLQSLEVRLIFCPQRIRGSLKTSLKLNVLHSQPTVVALLAQVQSPVVYLDSCELCVCNAFLDVPVVHHVLLVNQTLLPTTYEWCTQVVNESSGGDYEILMVPCAGVIGPRQTFQTNLYFTGHRLGELCDIIIPCKVGGMMTPLYLSLCTKVRGLSVSYTVAADDQCTKKSEELLLDFGNENRVGNILRRYLFIRNNSSIRVPYKLKVKQFISARPPAPPVSTSDNSNETQKKRSLLLAKTANLSDPIPRTQEQITRDICHSMLLDGHGAAFHISPTSGLLEAYQVICVEITSYSDTWGEYSDTLICQVESLDEVCIPILMTCIGCPVRFQFVDPKSDNTPILRFGTRFFGTQRVTRPARIVNTSSVDVRIDWRMFNRQSNDDRLINSLVIYGQQFPVLDSDGKEICSMDDLKLVPSYPPSNRPKIISFLIGQHDGVESYSPFTVSPRQLVIRAHQSSTIDVSMDPALLRCEEGRADSFFDSFADGFISILDQDRLLEGHLIRSHQYQLPPLRVTMTTRITSIKLEVVCEEEEGMLYHLAASDLLLSHNVVPVTYKVCSMTLCNRNESALQFSLRSSQPFYIVNIDKVTKLPVNCRTISHPINLNPGQNTLVSVAFCLSSTCLNLFNSSSTTTSSQLHTTTTNHRQDDGGEEKQEEVENNTGQGGRPIWEGEVVGESVKKESGVELETVIRGIGRGWGGCGGGMGGGGEGGGGVEGGAIECLERRIRYRRNLFIDFNNKQQQMVSLDALVILPTLKLSTDCVDFETCFIGQTKEIKITLYNPTHSDSQWICTLDSSVFGDDVMSHDNCCDNVFNIEPRSGLLSAHITHVSHSHINIIIYFTPTRVERYKSLFLFGGVLGEPAQRLVVHGQGTSDGRFEHLIK